MSIAVRKSLNKSTQNRRIQIKLWQDQLFPKLSGRQKSDSVELLNIQWIFINQYGFDRRGLTIIRLQTRSPSTVLVISRWLWYEQITLIGSAPPPTNLHHIPLSNMRTAVTDHSVGIQR